MSTDWPSAETLNNIAFDLVRRVIDESDERDIHVQNIGGATVLDFAVGRKGMPYSGVLLSQICLGGLARVQWKMNHELRRPEISVTTSKPLAACMGSQYAGWPISHESFFAMASGPMRMLRGKEAVLTQYNLVGESKKAIGVLESNELPTESVVGLIAEECKVDAKDICLCIARTASFPGSVQVVARSIETALHKLYELDFDLNTIVESKGHAPLPPIADDDMTALGWTNDAILYGGVVELTVESGDAAIEEIIEQVPSCSSPEFGTPFLDIFNKYDQDFYKIDKMLFSPAEVHIKNLKTGNEFHAGAVKNKIMKQSFGLK